MAGTARVDKRSWRSMVHCVHCSGHRICPLPPPEQRAIYDIRVVRDKTDRSFAYNDIFIELTVLQVTGIFSYEWAECDQESFSKVPYFCFFLAAGLRWSPGLLLAWASRCPFLSGKHDR